MVQTMTTPISGNLGAAFPDGMELDNTVVATALATPGAIKSGTANAETVLLQAYDVNGAAYKTFCTFTSADTPLCAFVQPAGALMTWDGGIIGGVTPAAGYFTTLGASGTLAAAAALTVGTTALFSGNATFATYALASVGNALTAVGTNRGSALQLAKAVNNVTTAASGTGVILPVGVVGMTITVFNAGANAIQVYASASETIDTVAGSTGVPLTNTKRANYVFTAANTWLSYQLGVVSA